MNNYTILLYHRENSSVHMSQSSC